MSKSGVVEMMAFFWVSLKNKSLKREMNQKIAMWNADGAPSLNPTKWGRGVFLVELFCFQRADIQAAVGRV